MAKKRYGEADIRHAMGQARFNQIQRSARIMQDYKDRINQLEAALAEHGIDIPPMPGSADKTVDPEVIEGVQERFGHELT